MREEENERILNEAGNKAQTAQYNDFKYLLWVIYKFESKLPSSEREKGNITKYSIDIVCEINVNWERKYRY